jgi:DNA replication protein DnaC
MSQAVLEEDAPRAPTVLRLPILLLLALAPPNGAAVTSSPCMEIQSQSPCPVCSGTGWKAIESEGVRSVIRCECFQKSKLDRLFQRAGVPPRYQFCAFESFNAMNESVNYAKTIAMKFVEEYPLDFGLLIMGPCGAGKTHLAVSILRELIYQQKTGGVFYDFRDLLKRIQNSYNSISQSSEMEILDPVLNCDVLVLDDLGVERPTEWVRDMFAYIINSRYNRKLATVMTTNFEDRGREARTLVDGTKVNKEETLEERIGTRLRSRLYEMCKVIEVDPPYDFRAKIMQPQYHPERR